MSNEIATVDQQSLAAKMGINLSEASGPKVGRLYVNQETIEKEIEVDGDTLNKTVVPKGAYKFVQGEDVVYSKAASIRIFATRKQYQRWNGDTEVMEKSVLATSLSSDLMDNTGGFNLGRSAGYIEDFKALPKETQEFLRKISTVTVLFGTVTLNNPVDANGNPVEGDYTAVPFIMDVKNRDSLKSLNSALSAVKRKNLLPAMVDIDLKPEIGKIPTGATFGFFSASVGATVGFSGEDETLLDDFLALIAYINGTIIDKHKEHNGGGLAEDEATIVGSIVEVQD